ncbi:hypothetical protein Golax_021600 [Gossypium laxum]|uniref:Disease resistance R13L4/SHOC-2-like LRR domain-containing protein n=1 Tax=Gossypium laxum TaxID=34288 RepID=A0A7J9ALU1_9ROSI|nr:hypothetical protein [Gossypium laxum]
MTGHILSLNLSLPPLDDTVDIDSYLMPLALPTWESLNLRGEDKFNEAGLLYVENLQWLSGLSLLKHLDLSLVDLSRASNWLQLVNTRLPSLKELHLSNYHLQLGRPLLNVNLSTLTVLDLSYNFFTNQLNLGWVSKLNSLVVLNLAGSDFHGPIPNFLRNMTSLRHLDLSYNNFKSSIPEWLYRFSSLQVLSLSANELQGDISSAIFNISTLNELDLSWNDLEGKLPRAVGNLCNLRSIVLSSVRLNQDISHIFEILSGKLANLEKVEIYNILLEGVVSEKHFANHTKLRYFEGSDNSLVLRANPYWLNATIGTRVLSLANNLLSREIPDCWIKWQSLQVLRLDGNRFTGKIPSSMGTLSELQSPHLHNKLHGEIPSSLKNCRELVAINLGKNELDDG